MSTTPTPTKQRTRVHPPTSEMSGEEMFDSLTGFEELAVKARFGATVNALAKTDETQMLRAFVFIDQKRRHGLKDTEAHKTAQGLTLGEVLDYFADEAEEPLEDDPVTDQGKDDTPPAGRHAS